VIYVEAVEEDKVSCVVNFMSPGLHTTLVSRKLSLPQFLQLKNCGTALEDFANNPLLNPRPPNRWREFEGYHVLGIAPAALLLESLLSQEDASKITAEVLSVASLDADLDSFIFPNRNHPNYLQIAAGIVAPCLSATLSRLTDVARSYYSDSSLVLHTWEFSSRGPSLVSSLTSATTMTIHKDRFYRWSTVSVFLNDDYEGGQLCLYRNVEGDGCCLIPAKTGRGVMFVGNATYHAPVNVRSGRRRQLILWFTSKDWLAQRFLFELPTYRLGDEPPSPYQVFVSGLLLKSSVRRFLWVVFARFDSDSDEVLSLNEILAWCTAANGRTATKDEAQQILTRFGSSAGLGWSGFEKLYAQQAFAQHDATAAELARLGYRREDPQ